MKKHLLAGAVLAGLVFSGAAGAQPGGLAAPETLMVNGTQAERSAAIFVELGKVLTNPRCTNCHPVGDRPRQGDEARLHQPPVFRGADGFGTEALAARSATGRLISIPGASPGMKGGTWRR